MNLTWVGL